MGVQPTVVLTVAHSTVASWDLRGAIDVVSCELLHLAVQLMSEVTRQAGLLLAIMMLFGSYERLHIPSCTVYHMHS